MQTDVRALQGYTGSDFRAALERLLGSSGLPLLVKTYFPEFEYSAFLKMARKIKSVGEFQGKVISRAMEVMLTRCADGVSLSGIDHLRADRRYLFMSTHRDIILDPALLTQRLYLLGYGTPKICLGDNLLIEPFVADLIKMNKAITVKRNLPPRELLRWSHALSEAISGAIKKGEDSVWIAQREGRTKDGRDRTQVSLVKMLGMAGRSGLLHHLAELHVVPVAVSYEYDPCDALKARELYLRSAYGEYRKAAGEDRVSMFRGMWGFKGRIHISIGRELGAELEQVREIEGKKEQAAAVALGVDRQIRQLYRLWPSNFVAADLLGGNDLFKDRYTVEQLKDFVHRIEKSLDELTPSVASASEREGIRRKMLESYAEPAIRGVGRSSAAA